MPGKIKLPAGRRESPANNLTKQNMEKPITKYCTNCKFCVFDKDNAENSKCSNPHLLSLVTGEPRISCTTERGSCASAVYPCGKEGALFERLATEGK
jgi:sulfatase maturation enzyme AslB (radical SAM superfamily)